MKRSTFLKNALDIWPRRDTNCSISIQEGQPNLTFRRVGCLARYDAGFCAHGFRKYVKRLAEGGDHFAILPGAVRQDEIQQAAFFARFLLREGLLTGVGDRRLTSGPAEVGDATTVAPPVRHPVSVLGRLKLDRHPSSGFRRPSSVYHKGPYATRSGSPRARQAAVTI